MTNTVSGLVSDEALDSIIQIESGGRPTIKASTSSALGLGQFLNATWLGTVKKHRPDVMRGKSTAQVLAMRLDPSFSIEMLARFTEDNMDVVGRNCAPGDLYLAHFLGAGMAQRFFRASRNTNAVTLAGEAAAQANASIFYNADGTAKTTGQVRDWAASKMAKAGGKGWVKKYYKPTQQKLGMIDEPDVPAEVEFDGDQDLLEVQTDLKAMNYNPGDLDGLWGGGTLGALGGFILDWRNHNFIPAPQSLEDFHANLDAIKVEVDQAIEEGFVRPVKESRKSEKVEDVAKIAPEIVPVQQNATWSLRAFLAGIAAAALNFLNTAWNWFLGNKDNLPTDPGVIKTGLGYLQAVPPGVWILLAAVAFGLIYRNSKKGAAQITEGVTTASRL